MKLIDLHEASVNDKPTYTDLQIDKAVDIIQEYCSESIVSLLHGQLIWRGDVDYIGKALIITADSKLTSRKSQNTRNCYTEIFDAHPEMSEFPKRSKSFVCSTSQLNANTYAYDPDANARIIIPYDSAKIGAVNKTDIWEISIKVFGFNFECLNYINPYINDLVQEIFDDSTQFIHKLELIDKKLKDRDKKAVSEFQKIFRNSSEKDLDYFLDNLYDAFSPEKTGMTWMYPEDFRLRKPEGELWIQGKMLMIEPNAFDDIKDKLK